MSGKGFDTRKLMTGKDGKLFITLDGVSIWFASVEEFTIGMNFSNVDFHPAGDVQTYGVPDSVKFTASFTEAVVRDDLTIVPMLEAIKNGKIPTFSLQGGVTEPLAGGESKYLLDECIPDGDTNILEVKPGEIIKRQCQFIVNSVPDCIKSLAAYRKDKKMAEKKTNINVTEENEMDLITGLLKAAEYKTEVSQTLNIQRNGQKLFKFDIRPLSFDEITDCRKRATTYMPNPGGASLPLIEKSVSSADYMAWQIYIATVPESDGTKFWDNPALKEGLNKAGHMVMTQAEIIKEILTAGELEAVSDKIEELSGSGTNVIDYAKN